MEKLDFISPLTPKAAGLNTAVADALAQRIDKSSSYDSVEIDHVSTLNRRLFPEGFELDERATKNFRLLCRHSRTNLRLPHQITSHRRLIGPLIVFLKRVSQPLVSFYLKETLQEIQEFHVSTVVVLAEQHFASKQ